MRWKVLSVFLLVMCPLYAEARVVINEIAWMGTDASANDEWIELYNSATSSVDITGWKVAARDGSPEIVLEGVISGESYFLLERTDDNSVPDISADQIYVGSLSNSGETLQLIDTEETLHDEVSGGEGWENIGGDNQSKQTPQRQSDDTWVTGVPTPKMANSTEDAGETDEDDTSTGTVTPPKKKQHYEQETFAHIFGGSRQVTAGSIVSLRGIAFRESGRKQRSARYIWNMGNGERRFGEATRFSYEIAGDYTVILKVVDGYDQIKKSIEITALPATVAIHDAVPGTDGYVTLYNGASLPLDLSEWTLSDGKTSFVFPDDTVIGTASKVPLVNSITELRTATGTPITLYYPNGDSAATYEWSE